MKTIDIYSKIKFEIGDRVKIDGGKYATITDIAFVKFMKSGETMYKYEVNNSGQYNYTSTN